MSPLPTPESLQTQVEDLIDAPIQAALKGLQETNPEAFKEALLATSETAREFVHGKAEIDFEALRKSLTIKQKFGLMVRLWLTENLGASILESGAKMKESPVHSFESEIARLKADKETAQYVLDEHNIVWPRHGNLLDRLDKSLSVMQQVVAGGEEGKDQFRLVGGNVMVMPEGAIASNLIGKGSLLRSLGLNFRAFSPRETVPAPKEDEIFVVLAPAEGLPKTNGALDREALEGFKALKAQGNNQWFSPEVLAAVLKLEGSSTEEAFSKAKIDSTIPGYATLKSDLDSLTA